MNYRKAFFNGVALNVLMVGSLLGNEQTVGADKPKQDVTVTAPVISMPFAQHSRAQVAGASYVVRRVSEQAIEQHKESLQASMSWRNKAKNVITVAALAYIGYNYALPLGISFYNSAVEKISDRWKNWFGTSEETKQTPVQEIKPEVSRQEFDALKKSLASLATKVSNLQDGTQSTWLQEYPWLNMANDWLVKPAVYAYVWNKAFGLLVDMTVPQFIKDRTQIMQLSERLVFYAEQFDKHQYGPKYKLEFAKNSLVSDCNELVEHIELVAGFMEYVVERRCTANQEVPDVIQSMARSIMYDTNEFCQKLEEILQHHAYPVASPAIAGMVATYVADLNIKWEQFR